MRRVVAVFATMLALAACGRPADETDAGSASRPSAAATGRAPTGPEGSRDPAHEDPSMPSDHGPPPVTVSAGGTSLDLQAWTFCFDMMCVDGIPPEEPLDIGTADEVSISFPLEGWSFQATFRASNERCGREFHTTATETGDRTFVLRPAGYAGTYDVELFGAGNGDLVVSFRWTTTSDGVIEPPEARLAVLADHDGVVDSYGVELEISKLPSTPEDASATVTVTAANGESLSFDATPSRIDCLPEGTLYWDGPDRAGLEAATLGEPPFTYDVELVLDGVTYTASATWPGDEIDGNEPSSALEVTPALPTG